MFKLKLSVVCDHGIQIHGGGIGKNMTGGNSHPKKCQFLYFIP